MMKHELIEQWNKMEWEAIDRRHFLKILMTTGLLTLVSTNKAHALRSQAKGKIVIIGGGAAGISMAAYLKRRLDQPDITIIDLCDRHYYQPGFSMIATGICQPNEIWKKQSDCIPSDIKWIKDSVLAIDPVWNQITTKNHSKLSYDFLVLTPQVQINWNQIEGISRDTLGQGNAHSMYDFEGAQKTWKALQEFSQKGGHGICTDTFTAHTCEGAPKEICLLTDDYTRKQGTRDHMTLDFFSASEIVLDVPYYATRLLEIYKERNIPINLNVRLKGVDTTTKQVHFERIEKRGEEKIYTTYVEDYDFLHFTPPMSAPDFVRESGLGCTKGKLAEEAWVMVDKATLVHKKYLNIISFGDVASIPTGKTNAATCMQMPIAAKNLISLMEGKEPTERYNEYAACPIATDFGHVLVCEFDYNKNPQTTFPFTLLDSSKEYWMGWLMKVYMQKPLYFYRMLKGYV